MDSKAFFSELQNFLPVYVSPVKSYARAAIAFAVVMSAAMLLQERLSMKIDIDGDGIESEVEERMRSYIYFGSFLILALLASDLTYTVSWRLSNMVNLKHLGYRRWFPNIYS